MDKIGFLDLKKQYHTIKNEIAVAIQGVLDITAFSDGPFVQSFEKNFAKYCEADYSMAVNSGTSALHLAMLALDIKEGDEVILPANTFIATAWAPTYVGAKLVFVDCLESTWNIDPVQVEAAITPKTKAIIGVHLYGQPCAINELRAIADKHNIAFVEDSAQAHGAKYHGKRVGQFGDLACFSFYPGKNLGTYGEGGGITTNNQAYDKHIRKLRNHGCEERYYHDIVGYNMRMGGIEGAVLDVKLKYIDQWNNRRVDIANRYFSEINNDKVKFQKQPEGIESVYHLLVVIVEDRQDFIQFLNDNNIFPGQHYPVPCHLQKAYNHLGHKEGDFPNSEYLAAHCVTLPMFAELKDEEVAYIIDTINKY